MRHVHDGAGRAEEIAHRLHALISEGLIVDGEYRVGLLGGAWPQRPTDRRTAISSVNCSGVGPKLAGAPTWSR